MVEVAAGRLAGAGERRVGIGIASLVEEEAGAGEVDVDVDALARHQPLEALAGVALRDDLGCGGVGLVEQRLGVGGAAGRGAWM